MINRDLIRRKIVQLTYAYYQNAGKSVEDAVQELEFSLSKAYDLYNYMLLLIVSITREERRRVEVARQRAEREGAPAPSDKLAENKFAMQLEGCRQLQERAEQNKLTWNADMELVRKLCQAIEQSETCAEYLASDDNSYEADREVWRKLYRQLIQDNADIDTVLEEKSLYWNDDREVVDTFVLKTIKRFDPKNNDEQELLPEYKDPEDREFATRLFRATILNCQQYQALMSQTSHRWAFTRLAYMDVVLMQIAIAEMLNFPNIPLQVSINEYVDLAKAYSTPKSGGYINGMLDAIARNLVRSGQLMKPLPERKKKPAAQTAAPGLAAEPAGAENTPELNTTIE